MEISHEVAVKEWMLDRHVLGRHVKDHEPAIMNHEHGRFKGPIINPDQQC